MGKRLKKQPKKWRVRREAGEWVRQGLRTRALVSCLVLVALLSSVVILSLAWAIGLEALYWPVIALTALVMVAFLIFEKRTFRNWLRGSLAERSVGGTIESALTAPGCAVAHSVYELPGTVGDIDHLVATPGGLWCIETKSGRVPKKQFRKVLLRIVQNAEAVQRWAPGVEVRGCLVVAQDDAIKRRRTYENGRVRLLKPGELYRELGQSAQATPTEKSMEVARRVWKLSGLRLSDG